jgi:CHAD domain-containing protein
VTRRQHREQLEREVKLGAWPGFQLPDLDDLPDGLRTRTRKARRLEATYYDTPDARLARAGVSLRHRSGDGTGWTLKLPDGDGPSSNGVLRRRELTFPGDGRSVPSAVERLLASWVRTSSLVPVARLATVRRAMALVDEDGEVRAEVVDDEVSVLHGRRVATRFREVEAEVAPEAAEDLLPELVTRLRAAGAGPPDPTSKVRRALGPLATGPPELAPVELGPDPTGGEVLRAAVTSSVLRLLEHDLGVRLGESPEDVHQARVATRRLRSDLRTYGDLLEPAWAEELRSELSGLADALGALRDADVLLDRLRGRAPQLREEDRPAAGQLVAVLERERGGHRRALLERLDGDAYRALLDRLVEGARAPQVTARAGEPAATVLPELASRPWRKLKEAVQQVEADGPDEQLHQVRIRAKRARYAADVAALAVGRPASRFAKAAAGLQDVLGRLQDAAVTEAWLRSAAEGARRPVVLVAGQLVCMERDEAEQARSAWQEAWDGVRKPAVRSWLTTS